MTIRTVTYDDETHVLVPINPPIKFWELANKADDDSMEGSCCCAPNEKLYECVIAAAPPFTSLPNHDLDVLQAENELFRAAIDADPTFGNMKPDLDVIEQALEIASDLSLAHASDVHITYAGYKPGKHAAVDAEVEKIKQAIAALKRIKGDASAE